MAVIDIDVAAERAFVNALKERFEQEEIDEIEGRRAEDRGLDGIHALLSVGLVSMLLRDLEYGRSLSRLNELRLERDLRELHEQFPDLAPVAWAAFLADHEELASLATLDPAAERRDANRQIVAALAALTEDSVHEALRVAALAAGGETQARDVAIELIPEIAPVGAPSRQWAINRVSAVIRRLESAGRARRTRQVGNRGIWRWAPA